MSTVRKPLNDDVCMWAEPGGPIMLRAASGADPVELTDEQAERVAAELVNLVAGVRAKENGRS